MNKFIATISTLAAVLASLFISAPAHAIEERPAPEPYSCEDSLEEWILRAETAQADLAALKVKYAEMDAWYQEGSRAMVQAQHEAAALAVERGIQLQATRATADRRAATIQRLREKIRELMDRSRVD